MTKSTTNKKKKKKKQEGDVSHISKMLQTGLFSVFSIMTSYIVFMAYLLQTQLGTGVAVVVLTFQPTKGYSQASLVA